MCALRVGIVGAAGQVGLAMLRGINQKDGISAVGICRSDVSAARVVSQGLDVRVAQTDDPERLAQATADLDALVNCALPQYGPSKTSAANRRLARALTIASSGKHLIHLSSVAVYGDLIRGDKRLYNLPKPDTSYGRQKLQMEVLLRKFAKKHSTKCTVLRVGHVYGPELRWSEAIFDLIRDERFRLPFGGQHLSNAIAVSNLVATVRAVLLTPPDQRTLNATDVPQTSWRELFDLHSEACDGPLVASLRMVDSEEGARERKKWAKTGMLARFVRETLSWIRQLPGSYLASVPTLKAILQQTVAFIGSETLDNRLWAFYSRRFAPRIQPATIIAIEPIFFSDPVPGPCVDYASTAITEMIPALRSWHEMITPPLKKIRSESLSRAHM